ncbi:MAG TPA: hypothetical protein VL069_11145 [Opitutus sp.]|nr:hypothetical protein [Opitutus sp.]
MKTASKFPVAVIGAGPVGLAAAAHLFERGQTPLVLATRPHAWNWICQRRDFAVCQAPKVNAAAWSREKRKWQ